MYLHKIKTNLEFEMSVNSKIIGASLALTAASLFSLSATTVVAAGLSATEQVHCYGVNKCQGHNDCKTATNACAGQGSCNGLGFVTVSEKACDDIGGKTEM
jgi:uncharacterized membrane protein